MRLTVRKWENRSAVRPLNSLRRTITVEHYFSLVDARLSRCDPAVDDPLLSSNSRPAGTPAAKFEMPKRDWTNATTDGVLKSRNVFR
jgi:hypothetical protein